MVSLINCHMKSIIDNIDRSIIETPVGFLESQALLLHQQSCLLEYSLMVVENSP